MKKALGVISAAVLMASVTPAAFAQSSYEGIEKYLAVDQLAGMTFGAPTALALIEFGGSFSEGSGDGTGVKVSVLAGAINYNDINASVNMDASTLNMTSGNAANSLSLVGIDETTSSIAYLGNRITTVAAGAVVGAGGVEADISTESYLSAGVMSAAINTGDINASVNLNTTSFQDGLFSNVAGSLNMSNLSISTTAIGASNSSLSSLKVATTSLSLPN
jgi:hypothetical protein